MKKTLSFLCIFVVLIITTPTSFAANLMRGDCDTLIGPKKTSCLRRQQRQSSATDAKSWREQNSDLARQKRTARRADIGGRSATSKSLETLRKEHIEELRNQRLKTQSGAQHRYDERKARREEQKEERLSKLKLRYGSTRQNVQAEKSQLRSRSQRLRDRSQTKREAIRQAHEECKALGVGERLQWLQRARNEEFE